MAVTAASCRRRLLLALLSYIVGPVFAAGGVTTSEKDVPSWASHSKLKLSVSNNVGLQFAIIPLTEHLGLNESQSVDRVINIEGELRSVNASNYKQISGLQYIAYLSCDRPPGDGFITPDKMLNDLMSQQPKAIVLYSTSYNWCSLKSTEPLSYESILTMADAGEASNVLSFFESGSSVNALIRGNHTDDQTINNGSNGGGGHNSAVAMSILYSITGLITLLFLIIIATGAIRAHRYPERCGPRSAAGGQPRQSRAKGLARAVLDTIPIVKFGNAHSPKPDPQLELETAKTDLSTQHPAVDRRANAAAAPRWPSRDAKTSTTPATAATDGAQTDDGHLGCSICTDDFKVGENVRVLPCNHQFHPNCVDPWLVNVSGTCPLCRLDLRPGQGGADGSTGGDGESLPPPLALEGENHGSPNPHGTRFARLLDINRLRQAPVEERIEALRQMRAHTGDEGGRHPHGARLTKKLKETFRIRTRAQLAGRREG